MSSPTLFPLLFLLSFFLSPIPLLSQQPYEGVYTTQCSLDQSTSNSSSLLGYFCTISSNSCISYLTFNPIQPYNTTSSISSLLNISQSLIPQFNSNPNSKLLIPINCSCSGNYSQYTALYSVQSGDTLLLIANNTYQGLSTCQAIRNQNSLNSNSEIVVRETLKVPLRCACPTARQVSAGVKYLVSYLVEFGDTLGIVANLFGVEIETIKDANELNSDNINPFTTLLVPLNSTPSSSVITPPVSPPPPPPISLSPSENKSNHTGIYVAIGVSVTVLILIASLVAFLLLKRKKKRNHAVVSSTNDSSQAIKKSDISADILLSISDIGSLLKVYTYQELQLASDNFSSENQIGGSVYRALFKGDLAAIKIMDKDVSIEIDILKQINHFNLIRLSGVCFHEGYWYLVCEYAENGPLSNWVLNKNESTALNWAQRLQSSLDIASGLNYLHSFTQPAYVHMDIRTSGILLDSNFRAKISNLGRARPAGGKQGDFTLTSHIAGTRGYLSPEYIEHGLVSPKVDVYAFGVVLLEIFTGKEISELETENNDLFDWLNELVSKEDGGERIKEFLDPLLNGDYSIDLGLMLIKLIEVCLRWDAGNRPSMGEISQYLARMSDMSLSWQSKTESQSFSSDKGLLMRD